LGFDLLPTLLRDHDSLHLKTTRCGLGLTETKRVQGFELRVWSSGLRVRGSDHDSLHLDGFRVEGGGRRAHEAFLSEIPTCDRDVGHQTLNPAP